MSSVLRKKAVQSGKDTAIIAIAERLIALTQLFILARLLNPEAFGLYSIAMAIVIAGTVFTSLGTERILIQRAELDNSFIGSAWLLELLRGVAVSLSCLLLAPYYAVWMHAPEAKDILYYLAFIPFFTSLQTPALVIAERNLLFRRVVLFQVVTSLFQLTFLVAFAYAYRDVYALAIGFTITTVFRSLFSWLWFGIPNLPHFNKEHFKELFSTGKHYFVIALGGYVMTQGDNLMVGNLLGVVMLGYYVMAYQISQWPVDILSKVISRVALPVFSRLQADPARLSRAFDQVLQVQLLFLVPVITAITLFAPILVPVILGTQYLPSVFILQLMVFIIIGRGMSHVLDPFIIGAGYVSFASKVKIFETSMFLIALWYGIQAYGVEGAAVGAGIGYMFAALVRIIFVCRVAKYSIVNLMRRLFAPLVASLLSMLVVLGMDYALSLSHTLTLLAEGTLFTLIYILVSILLDKTWLDRFKELLHSKNHG